MLSRAPQHEQNAGQPVRKVAPFQQVNNGTAKVDISAPLGPTIIDIDVVPEDQKTYFVPEYVSEIYDYLRSKEPELKCLIDPQLTTYQDCVRNFDHSRRLLVNWMHKLSKKLCMANECIYLATQTFDRYTAAHKLRNTEELQQAALASLYIGSKFEETYSPSLRTIVNAVGRDITSSQVAAMERNILGTLDWYFAYPTTIVFLRRFTRVSKFSDRQRYFSFFLAEMAMFEQKMNKYTPSDIAAAAISLTRKAFKFDERWNSDLVRYSKLTKEDFDDCYKLLAQLLTTATKERYLGVFEKYEETRYYNITSLVEKMLNLR